MNYFIFLILFSSTLSLANEHSISFELKTSNKCILKDGKVKCWGKAFRSKNLPTTEYQVPEPRDFDIFPKVKEIKLATSYGCAVSDLGETKCWGAVPWNPSFVPSPQFVVNFGGKVRQISLGKIVSCALLESGEVTCMGHNYGNHKIFGKKWKEGFIATPVKIDLPEKASMIQTEMNHTCALLENDEVWCWGRMTTHFDTNFHADLQKIKGLEPVKDLAVTDSHVCALEKSGGVKCWGRNHFGELGRGNETERYSKKIHREYFPEPKFVINLEKDVKSISAYYHDTCAVKVSGEAYCWGQNNSGAAGVAITVPANTPFIDKPSVLIPQKVMGISDAERVVVGSGTSCAYLKDGKIKCWGKGFNFLGNGDRIHVEPYEFKYPEDNFKSE